MSDDRAFTLVLTADGDRIKVPVRKPHRPCVPRLGA